MPITLRRRRAVSRRPVRSIRCNRARISGGVISAIRRAPRSGPARSTSSHRFFVTAELVGAVVYLASDASSFTTGEVLTVDSGLTLR